MCVTIGLFRLFTCVLSVMGIWLSKAYQCFPTRFAPMISQTMSRSMNGRRVPKSLVQIEWENKDLRHSYLEIHVHGILPRWVVKLCIDGAQQNYVEHQNRGGKCVRMKIERKEVYMVARIHQLMYHTILKVIKL